LIQQNLKNIFDKVEITNNFCMILKIKFYVKLS